MSFSLHKNIREQELNARYTEYGNVLDPKSFFMQWGKRVETQSLYPPSIWTLTFMEGINNVQLPKSSKPSIMEIGVGTGLATAFMAEKWRDAEIFCIDIDERAIELSKRNIGAISGKEALERCHFFVSDVLLPIKIRKNTDAIDAIFGNLPFKETNLSIDELLEGNAISNGYSVHHYKRWLNELISDPNLNIEKTKQYYQIINQNRKKPRLLLHRILFSEARDVLASGGSLVVTCSDSNKPQMEQLLHEYGFHTEVSAINYEHEDEEGIKTHRSNIIYAISASL